MKRKERRAKERKEMKKLKKENPELYNEKLTEKFYRNTNERANQVLRLSKKLLDIGFLPDLSGIKRFREVSKKFVEDGEVFDDVITFEELPGVLLIVVLSPHISVECSITVKNWKGVQ